MAYNYHHFKFTFITSSIIIFRFFPLMFMVFIICIHLNFVNMVLYTS